MRMWLNCNLINNTFKENTTHDSDNYMWTKSVFLVFVSIQLNFDVSKCDYKYGWMNKIYNMEII